MLPRRGRVEIAIAVGVLAAVLGVASTRAPRLGDDAVRARTVTAASHFQAGLALLRAESRARSAPGSNALGYPTGDAGRLANASDCRGIWKRVMADSSALVAAHFVSDMDGSGDRCEFVVAARAGAPELRIVYWPLGSTAALATIDDRTVHVGVGEHVFVADGVESADSG